MGHDKTVSGLNLFLHKNTYFLVSAVPFKVVSLRLYTMNPAIMPLFEACYVVHGLKLDKYFPHFCLNYLLLFNDIMSFWK
jgi:hypothetical protein